MRPAPVKRGPLGGTVTVSQSDVIDLVSHDPARDVVTLSLVEERPWGDHGELLVDLQAKLNTYLGYVEHQLTHEYPKMKGKPLEFHLHYAFPLGSREREFVRILRQQYLNPAGIAWAESQFSPVPPN